MNTPPLLPDALAHALGWALVHSLWQGALAALTLWLALPRLRDAAARYRTAYASLLATFFAAIATFSMIYEPKNTAGNAPAASLFSENTGALDSPFLLENAPAPNLWAAASAWLDAHHEAIVLVWLMGFGFFLLRLGGGLFYVRQMRSRQVSPVPESLRERFESLLARAEIRRPVSLLESALARTPMVIGYLKPVVLLPVGLINQLAPTEIEAVLAHELAHIARRDWLLNLAQAFIEAVFYYHPAIWWMSATVRAERENCCDDVAVSLCGNRLFYAKTLLRVQEIARENCAPVPALALALEGKTSAAFGRRSSLLARVRRILNQSQTTSPIMEKLTATGILLALIGLLAVRAQSAPIVFDTLKDLAETPVEWVAEVISSEPENDIALAQMATDSVPAGKKNVRKISSDDGERQVEMTLENDQLTALKVDGKDIPPAEFDQYEDLTDEVLGEAFVMPAMPPLAPMAPMSPMPPMPGMAPMAPMPPMPGMAPMSPMSPATPAPYFLGSGTARVFSEKDANGNTIIRLESEDGKPTKIEVKDGKVFINGEAAADGQAISIGRGEGDGHSYFYWNGDGGHHVAALAPDCHIAWSGDVLTDEAALAEHRAARESALRESREHLEMLEKEMKTQRKELEKNQKQQRRELERQMDETRRAVRQAAEEQERAARESHRARDAARREAELARRDAYQSERSNRFSQTVRSGLIREGIIREGDEYAIELSEKSLRVNGKKQSAEIHQKYLNLYRDMTGLELKGKDKVHLNEKH